MTVSQMVTERNAIDDARCDEKLATFVVRRGDSWVETRNLDGCP
jgi:hypothetical protein